MPEAIRRSLLDSASERTVRFGAGSGARLP